MTTTFLTVISGTLVFSLGQIFSRFFIDPIHALKLTIAHIDEILIFHANRYANPSMEQNEAKAMDECQAILRQCASELRSKVYLVPCYGLFAKVGAVPKAKEIQEAATFLIQISNNLRVPSHRGTANAKAADKIRLALGLFLEQT